MVTPGVNFINILLDTFLYKSVFRSFSLIRVWFCNFFGKKIFSKELLIKCWWNWLKVSISSTSKNSSFIWKFFAQILCAYSLGLQFFGKGIFAQKLLLKCCWKWLQFHQHFMSSFSCKSVIHRSSSVPTETNHQKNTNTNCT